ncbi:MAG: leucyl aminopeptidase [Gammaproteobacteria bacterium]|nr:leucyl aminopeptidase [Gammaproteobacteria bacterium]
MNYSIKRGRPHEQKTQCLVLGIFRNKRLTATAEAIDKRSRGAIRKVLASGDLDGSPGQTAVLHNVSGSGAARVLLVGCGASGKTSAREFSKAAQGAGSALARMKARNAVSCLSEITVGDTDIAWRLRQEIIAVDGQLYRFEATKKGKQTLPALQRYGLLVDEAEAEAGAKAAVTAGSAIGAGMRLTRDLGNRPANHCTPTHLADEARALASAYKSVTAKIVEEAQMEKLGMGALLSVSRGSRQPAKLIVLHHNGGARGDAPVALVGKGVTFDTGGISIKPSAAMDEMKYDMCGAASVLGVMRAVAEMKLPINVVGVVPATENMPDGLATKPGDVVTTMSGKTVEILNTDAEGRLILCDALTYVGQFEPDVVIDIATLTGACVIALGHHVSGMMSNNDELAAALTSAGETALDAAWRLPLGPDYDRQLDTPFADMANIGGRSAGAITAGCFLARFAEDYSWAHIDIAGTAWVSGKEKNATARPVPLLVQYLMDRLAAD